MKSRLLGLAVVLVAIAVLVNALALSTADITSKVNINVVGSQSALIAITEATGQDPDIIIDDSVNGSAVISIADLKGLQPGSVYVFSPAFSIVNNSNTIVDFTIPVPTVEADGVHVLFEAVTPADMSGVTADGDYADIKMTVTVDEGAGTVSLPDTPFTIHVAKAP